VHLPSLLSRGSKLASRLPRNAWLALLALAVFAAALVYVMAPMLSAQFSAIDDHEIVSIIGPSGHIAPTEIPGKIAQYAVESNGRFRPGYYVLRIFEAAAAGTNPQLWYLDRFILAFVAAVALLALAYGFVTRLTLLVLPLMLLAGPQAEIWTRLGPQESYAVPIVLAGLALVRWRHRSAGVVLLLAAGLIKENFVLLIPAVVAWLAWREGRTAWRTIVCVGVVGGIEAAAVAIQMARYGDFYGQTRSVGSIVGAIRHMLGQFAVDDGWYLAGLLGVAAMLALRGGPRARTAAVLSVAALALVFLPQAYFYGGNPPIITGRYLEPALLFAILVAGLGYWVAEGVGTSRAWMAASLIVALISGLLMVPQLRTQHQTANDLAAGSRSFQAGIHEIEDLLREDPSSWVVLRPDQSVRYYEPDFSIAVYLENGPTPPRNIAIEVPPLAAGAGAGSLEQRLQIVLTDISDNGGSGFQALPPNLAPGQCIEVDFLQARTDSRCTRVVVIGGV
jgi:hypothetical protein